MPSGTTGAFGGLTPAEGLDLLRRGEITVEGRLTAAS
ncbi:MAG: phosphatidylinositol kinase, partial [Nocardiopsis sp. BM-2018]